MRVENGLTIGRSPLQHSAHGLQSLLNTKGCLREVLYVLTREEAAQKEYHLHPIPAARDVRSPH